MTNNQCRYPGVQHANASCHPTAQHAFKNHRCFLSHHPPEITDCQKSDGQSGARTTAERHSEVNVLCKAAALLVLCSQTKARTGAARSGPEGSCLETSGQEDPPCETALELQVAESARLRSFQYSQFRLRRTHQSGNPCSCKTSYC